MRPAILFIISWKHYHILVQIDSPQVKNNLKLIIILCTKFLQELLNNSRLSNLINSKMKSLGDLKIEVDITECSVTLPEIKIC